MNPKEQQQQQQQKKSHITKVSLYSKKRSNIDSFREPLQSQNPRCLLNGKLLYLALHS